MLGVVMSDVKTLPPVRYEGSMNNVAKKNILTWKVFPALQATYGKGGFVWTQETSAMLLSTTSSTNLNQRDSGSRICGSHCPQT